MTSQDGILYGRRNKKNTGTAAETDKDEVPSTQSASTGNQENAQNDGNQNSENCGVRTHRTWSGDAAKSHEELD